MEVVPGLTENIRQTCEGLAKEIADRCTIERGGQPDWMNEIVQRHALGVLTDWFLGDFIPEHK